MGSDDPGHHSAGLGKVHGTQVWPKRHEGKPAGHFCAFPARGKKALFCRKWGSRKRTWSEREARRGRRPRLLGRPSPHRQGSSEQQRRILSQWGHGGLRSRCSPKEAPSCLVQAWRSPPVVLGVPGPAARSLCSPPPPSHGPVSRRPHVAYKDILITLAKTLFQTRSGSGVPGACELGGTLFTPTQMNSPDPQ